MHQRPFHSAHKSLYRSTNTNKLDSTAWQNPNPLIQVQDPKFVSAVTRRTPIKFSGNPKERDSALGNPDEPTASDFIKSPDTLEL